MPTASSSRPRFARIQLRTVLLTVLLILAAVVPAWTEMNVGKADPRPQQPPRRTEATYKVSAGLDGEVFPVFANYASLQKPRERKWGTVAVTVTNSTDTSLRSRIAVRVPGWSDQEIQIAEMGAGDVRTYVFAPSFLPRLYSNRELIAAVAAVEITDMAGRVVFKSTLPVRLRAAEDMYWGDGFKYAPFIASWVTPHDPLIERLLSMAKELAPGRRLPGYEEWKSVELQEKSSIAQIRAIYRALQRKGVSYVKSSITFGGNAELSERVRMPRESLRHVSANCIDGAVMYASLFENLGMEPVIVIVPGHAYVGVRLAQGADRYIYIDTALTGRATFENAVSAADRGLARYSSAQVIRVPITQSRQAGIYPMPAPGKSRQSASLDVQDGLQ